MTKLVVDLLPPKGLDEDELFDWYDERNSKVIHHFPVLWDPKFNDEFAFYVRGAIQRGEEEIRHHGKLREAGKDVVLTLTRSNVNNVHLRGDYRYPSDELARVLADTDYDLVPPVVGVSNAGHHLLDGHHRWRAYLLANIQPLILEIEVVPTHRQIPSIVAIVSPKVQRKSPINEDLLRTFIKECIALDYTSL